MKNCLTNIEDSLVVAAGEEGWGTLALNCAFEFCVCVIQVPCPWA